jgi:hypothetical protein
LRFSRRNNPEDTILSRYFLKATGRTVLERLRYRYRYQVYVAWWRYPHKKRRNDPTSLLLCPMEIPLLLLSSVACSALADNIYHYLLSAQLQSAKFPQRSSTAALTTIS